jgi:hypothetical protein
MIRDIEQNQDEIEKAEIEGMRQLLTDYRKPRPPRL